MKKIITLLLTVCLMSCNVISICAFETENIVETVSADKIPEGIFFIDYYIIRGNKSTPTRVSKDGENYFDIETDTDVQYHMMKHENGIYVFISNDGAGIPPHKLRGSVIKNSPMYFFDDNMMLLSKKEFDGRMEYIGFVSNNFYFKFYDTSMQSYNYETNTFEGEMRTYYVKTTDGKILEETTIEEFKELTSRQLKVYAMASGDLFCKNIDGNINILKNSEHIPIKYENEIPKITYRGKSVFYKTAYDGEELSSLKVSNDALVFFDIPADADIGSFVVDSKYFYCKKADTDLYYRIKVSEFNEGIKIIYNNCYLSFESSPVVENDRTLIPMRFLFEQMGADVSWDETTNTATVSKASDVVSFSIDNTVATVNAQPKTMDVPARLINDKTYIPLRFLSEELGYTVEWDEEANTVIITD